MRSIIIQPNHQRKKLGSLFWCALVVLILNAAGALAQPSFDEGKTITIIQGREPGGTGDMRDRAVIPFLRKYIPGQPTIVLEFMPGGGGRKAANHIIKLPGRTG